MNTLFPNLTSITARSSHHENGYVLKNASIRQHRQTAENQPLHFYQAGINLPGAYGTHNLRVSTSYFGKTLRISGAPFAHMYGQNIFTTSDVSRACRHMFDVAGAEDDLFCPGTKRGPWKAAEVDIERMDLTVNLKLASPHEVAEAFEQLKQHFAGALDKTMDDPNSLTFQLDGNLDYSIHIYKLKPSDACQNLEEVLGFRSRLAKEIENILCIHLHLTEKALRDLGLINASSWKHETAGQVFLERLRAISPCNFSAPSMRLEVLDRIPVRLRPVYVAYMANIDLRQIYPLRTLQRYKNIFADLGINIHSGLQNNELVRSQSIQNLMNVRNVCPVPSWLKEFCLAP